MLVCLENIAEPVEYIDGLSCSPFHKYWGQGRWSWIFGRWDWQILSQFVWFKMAYCCWKFLLDNFIDDRVHEVSRSLLDGHLRRVVLYKYTTPGMTRDDWLILILFLNVCSGIAFSMSDGSQGTDGMRWGNRGSPNYANTNWAVSRQKEDVTRHKQCLSRSLSHM